MINSTENGTSATSPGEPPDVIYYLMGIWALCTGTAGLVGNLLAILLFIVSPKLKTPFNYLLMNLSFCELFISVTGNWVLSVNSFFRRWILSFKACQANAFGMTFLGTMSIVTLAVLALQRFMMITQDRQFPLSTNMSAFFTLIFIWSYTFIVSVPPILGWGEFGLNTLKVSCGVTWDVNLNAERFKISYIFFIYFFGFILPLMIIFFSYTKIITTVKRSGTLSLMENDNKRIAKVKRDRKITNMVAMMLGSYLVTWFPYACISIAEAAGSKPTSDLTYFVHTIPTMLTKACVCLDPIIYLGFNPQFQSELQRVFMNKQTATSSTSISAEGSQKASTKVSRTENQELSALQ